MIALIMAGGVGTRFWPLSTAQKPKQFLYILGNRSMIQQTVDRILPIVSYEHIYVVTNKNQVGLVKEHLPQLPGENIIAEPVGRNTAPCIGLSAMLLREKYRKEETMLVLPADHYIGKQNEFLKAIVTASEFAKNHHFLVTFGIKPTFPATGYGYIESDSQIHSNGFHIHKVKTFREKPDYRTASAFLAKGNFYWNSGMFLWRLDTIIDAIKRLMPDLYTNLQETCNAWKKKDGIRVREIYTQLPKVPIDIGVMEKADNVAVVPLDIAWNDIGSWQAVYDMMPKDENGNVILGNIKSLNAKNNYVHSNGEKKLIALIGVEDLVIVDTGAALLICKKDHAQDVKKIAQKLM
jgi:mannose-1-phosphate guanylyltransferase